MEILGVGPLELILILIIALIVLGPNDMVKTSRTIGRTLRRMVKSPVWAAIQEMSHGLRLLPTYLMREAGLEEDIEDLRKNNEQLRWEMEQVRRIRASAATAFKGLEDESHSIGGGLEAWTTQPDEKPSQRGQTDPEMDALSAWVTPPSSSELSLRQTGSTPDFPGREKIQRTEENPPSDS